MGLMSIPFQYKHKSVKGIIRNKDHPLFDDDSYWVVWWHGGIVKNHSAQTQTYIKVAFRKAFSFNELSDAIRHQNVCISTLGQLRIGSIWRNNVCVGQYIFDTEDFDVNYSQNFWRINSFELAHKNNEQPPFNQERFKLEWENDKNHLLELNIRNGKKLIIPCLEYFARCYGRSSELKRILTSYYWDKTDKCCKAFLYAPLDEGEVDDGKVWKVKLKSNLVNDDVVILAHAKYDVEFAQKNIKLLYTQIESAYKAYQTNRSIFIQVYPWFEGPAKIRVSGIRLENGDFLGLNILGSSDPQGNPIQRDKVTQEQTVVDSSSSPPKEESEANQRPNINHPEILPTTGKQEPDRQSPTAEVFDETFVTLGTPRNIYDVRRDKEKRPKRVKTKETDPHYPHDLFSEAYASGEAFGNGKNVSQVKFKSPLMIESDGMLLSMWKAMLSLKENHPNQVTSVEWYSSDDCYHQTQTPSLIAITPFSKKDKTLKPDVKNWPYLVTKSCQVRGALVASMTIDSRRIYIIEIQRRIKADQSSLDGESYTGLVFEAQDTVLAKSIIDKYLDKIRYEKGVVKKTLQDLECKANFFKHNLAKGEKLTCHNVVINALGKMQIKLL